MATLITCHFMPAMKRLTRHIDTCRFFFCSTSHVNRHGVAGWIWKLFPSRDKIQWSIAVLLHETCADLHCNCLHGTSKTKFWMKSSNAFNVINLQTWETHSAAAEKEFESQPSLTWMRGLPTFVVPPLLEGLANQVTSSSLPDKVIDWHIKCYVPWHWDMAWELGPRIWHCFGGKKLCMVIRGHGSRHATCCKNLYCLTSQYTALDSVTAHAMCCYRVCMERWKCRALWKA